MYANMEQWAEIRRRVLVEGLSRREACKSDKLHWKTRQKMLRHAEPPGYRRWKPVRRPLIEPVISIIHQILYAVNFGETRRGKNPHAGIDAASRARPDRLRAGKRPELQPSDPPPTPHDVVAVSF